MRPASALNNIWFKIFSVMGLNTQKHFLPPGHQQTAYFREDRTANKDLNSLIIMF
jgi:hypothetical protein